jgi:hypothetical protein
MCTAAIAVRTAGSPAQHDRTRTEAAPAAPRQASSPRGVSDGVEGDIGCGKRFRSCGDRTVTDIEARLKDLMHCVTLNREIERKL